MGLDSDSPGAAGEPGGGDEGEGKVKGEVKGEGRPGWPVAGTAAAAQGGVGRSSPPRFGDRVAHVLAVWFGCGHVPVAPGTAGTLGALPLYLLIRAQGPVVVAGVAAAVTLVGIWASDRVARRLGRKDPQIVCIDEVAGVLIALIPAPRTTAALVAGVVLFRIFDQLKPWPARLAERRLPGGWGIVLDDVFAGLWGAAVLLAAQRFGLLGG